MKSNLPVYSAMQKGLAMHGGLDRFPVSFCYNGTPVGGLGEEFVLVESTYGVRPPNGVTETIRLRHRARSCYAQMLPLQTHVDDPATPWEEIVRLVREWREISTFYYADFYTLTEWNNDSAQWRGYMYFDPSRNAGFAQLFRPEHSSEAVRRIRFFGLSPAQAYHLSDTDGTVDLVCTGQDLLQGIDISLPQPLCAMVLHLHSIS